MKHSLITLFIFLLPFIASAQDLQVKFGSPIPEKAVSLTANASNFNRVFGTTETHYYVAIGRKNKLKIEKYDLNHQLVKTIKWGTKRKVKNLRSFKFIETADKKCFVLSTYEKKEKKLQILAFDFKDDEVGEEQVVFEYERKKVKGMAGVLMRKLMEQMFKFTPPAIFVSPDKKQVGLIVYNQGMGQNDREFNFLTLDSQLNVLHSKKENFSINTLFHSCSIIDNDGNFYGVAQLLQEDVYDFKLYKISKSGFKNYDIDIGERYAPTQVQLFLSKDKSSEVSLFGLYKKDYKGADKTLGVFFCDFKESKISNLKFNSFEKEASLSKLSIINEESDASYRINKVIQFEDGTFGIVAQEEYFEFIEEYGEIPKVKYFAGNIFYTKIDKNGDILHATQIERKASSTRTGLPAEIVLGSNNKQVYLLFNSTFKTPQIDGVIISDKGEIVKKKTIGEHLIMSPYLTMLENQVAFSDSKSLFLIYTKKGNRVGILKM